MRTILSRRECDDDWTIGAGRQFPRPSLIVPNSCDFDSLAVWVAMARCGAVVDPVWGTLGSPDNGGVLANLRIRAVPADLHRAEPFAPPSPSALHSPPPSAAGAGRVCS